MRVIAEGNPEFIGPYRIIGRLGHGGMGEVFLGELGGERVAIKRIHAGLLLDLDFRSRFTREVDVCRRVDSTTCARFVNADMAAKIPWMATEYIAGPNLQEAITAGGALQADQAEVVALGIAEALRQIHRAGIVHRDLKPSNVVLGVDGPRVIDFGIARAFDQTAFTRTGAMLGSPGWMAPEQIRDGELGKETDVFAWGALVAYAAGGRPPFGEALPETLMYRVLNEEPDLSGVPPRLQRLCRQALEKDSFLRPSAEELVSELLGTPATGPLSTQVTQRIDRTWILDAGVMATQRVASGLGGQRSSDETAAIQTIGAISHTAEAVESLRPRGRTVWIAAVALFVVAVLIGIGATVFPGLAGHSPGSGTDGPFAEAPLPVKNYEAATSAWRSVGISLPKTTLMSSIQEFDGIPTIATATGERSSSTQSTGPLGASIWELRDGKWSKVFDRVLGLPITEMEFVDLTDDGIPDLHLHGATGSGPGADFVLGHSSTGWRLIPFGENGVDSPGGPISIDGPTGVASTARDCVPTCVDGGHTLHHWLYDVSLDSFQPSGAKTSTSASALSSPLTDARRDLPQIGRFSEVGLNSCCASWIALVSGIPTVAVGGTADAKGRLGSPPAIWEYRNNRWSKVFEQGIDAGTDQYSTYQPRFLDVDADGVPEALFEGAKGTVVAKRSQRGWQFIPFLPSGSLAVGTVHLDTTLEMTTEIGCRGINCSTGTRVHWRFDSAAVAFSPSY